MMKPLETIVQEIKRDGFTSIPFMYKRNDFERAANRFLDFLELPLLTKSTFFAQTHPKDRGSTVGYVLRTGKTISDTSTDEIIKLDNKEYVHYNEYFEKYFGHLVNQPRVKEFIDEARTIYTLAKGTLYELLKEYEKEFPNIKEQFFAKRKPPRFYLRFLKYDNVGEDGTIAKPHYDRGALTLALAESSPGLRIGPKDKQVEVKHQDGQALHFPGMGIEEATRKGYLPPAWHDVVQKNKEPIRPGVARWSIVFFADLINQPEYTYDEAHQEKQ